MFYASIFSLKSISWEYPLKHVNYKNVYVYMDFPSFLHLQCIFFCRAVFLWISAIVVWMSSVSGSGSAAKNIYTMCENKKWWLINRSVGNDASIFWFGMSWIQCIAKKLVQEHHDNNMGLEIYTECATGYERNKHKAGASSSGWHNIK